LVTSFVPFLISYLLGQWIGLANCPSGSWNFHIHRSCSRNRLSRLHGQSIRNRDL
jgi:hypothetical protein